MIKRNENNVRRIRMAKDGKALMLVAADRLVLEERSFFCFNVLAQNKALD